jgi:hypothetical protein
MDLFGDPFEILISARKLNSNDGAIAARRMKLMHESYAKSNFSFFGCVPELRVPSCIRAYYSINRTPR